MSATEPAITPTCGEREAACACRLPLGHDGMHDCRDDFCGGQWGYDERGGFVIGRFPGMGRAS